MEKRLKDMNTILKVLLVSVITFASILVSPTTAVGKNYYFSTSAGNDTRTSTQAQNQSTPWKTISKLNSFFTSLVPGDSVLFKRGEEFYGSIQVVTSGTSSSPIVIGAYGTGTNPVITGFKPVTGWTNSGNKIWESAAIGSKAALNMVTVNGVNTPLGRYPNIGTENGGYLTYETSSGSTSITDNQLTGTPNWTGAEAVVRKTAWVINRCPITSHVNGTLNIQDASGYGGYNGWGYFIQNDIRTLDINGEWFLNKTTRKLSMYFSGNNPNSYNVKASTLDTIVYSYGRRYLTFINLTFEGGNEYGFYINAGDHITIQNCDINFIGKDAIYYPNHPYLTVLGCNISNINDNVISGTSNSGNSYIGYCNINKAYTIPGNAGVGDGHGFGVALRADNSIAEYNTINNTGYIALAISSNNSIIRNNYVDSACLIKDDGAAIYISGAAATIMSGRIIENNIVTNTLGNANGKSPDYPAKANGIYADGHGNNVLIQGNTVFNSSAGGIYQGFYSHDNKIINNILYNNTDNLRIIENDLVDNNCVFNGNILFADKSTNLIYAINGSEPKVYRPIESYGTWSGNYYIKPFDDQNVLSIRYNISTKQIFDGVTLNGWRKYDKTMKLSPISISPYKVNSLIGGNRISNGTFNSNTTGLRSGYNAKYSLSWDNTNKISGGSARLTYTLPLSTTNDEATLTLNVGEVTAGKKYILKFDLLGVSPDKAVMVYIRKTSSPYTPLTLKDKYFPFTNTATANEILLEPTISDVNADICFSFRDEDGTVYLDNVSFYEADVTKTNPADVIRFEYNPTKTAKTIHLPASYVDVKGTAYSNSITLLPFASAILIKSSNSVINLSPVILNQSFQINENSVNGTIVGTVNATDPNPGQTLIYSIVSGNTNSAFSINASSGILRVANSSALNFETLSSFPLIVKVQDNGVGSLSSQATMRVDVLDVNESPVIINQTFSVIGNTANGTEVGNVIATDPDGGQTKTYSIISGNTSNAFSINPSTGILTVLTSSALNIQTNPVFSLVIRVQDNGIGNLYGQATIAVNLTTNTGCTATGNITYQVWNNLGSSVMISTLTSNSNFPNNPTSSVLLTSMEGPTNVANEYGARIIGYICAPATGSYTFWISSDDNSELWLSTNDLEANKQRIAYHNSYTGVREWNKYTTQKSVNINLVQGQTYYVEALMKEGGGFDNLAVGWLKPGQTGTEPSEVIPGSVLSPFGTSQSVRLTSISLPSNSSVSVGSSITILATTTPGNATNTFLNWTTSNSSIATVSSSGVVRGVSAGSVTITASSTDGSNLVATGIVSVNLPACSAVGTIMYQVWNNIGSNVNVGSLTSNINYPDNPTSSVLITSMEGTANLANEFGARIAGYICAPATGNYTFWIASDDYGELWLSTDALAANKQRIAYHTGFTGVREWSKYPTQKSATIYLVQGQSYYIEALMKEGTGFDNLSVGWLKPGQSGSVPSEVVPGSVLSPISVASTILITTVDLPGTASVQTGSSIIIPATILPNNATNRNLTWLSSNNSVATVDDNGRVTGVTPGNVTITAVSTDGGNISGSCLVTVNSIACAATGVITYQVWYNIGSGVATSVLTSNTNYPGNPSLSTTINSMEGTLNLPDNSGSRIAGYICAPTTGSYTFWIASDDYGELWLSTDEKEFNKQIIAYHTGYTGVREWNKYSTQKSTVINLVKGQTYYIEALMKEGLGYDNLAVGWLKPGQSGTTPSEVIPGSVLSPINAVSTVQITSVSLPSAASVLSGSQITIAATSLPGNATNPVLNWTSSNTSVAIVNTNGVVTGIAEGIATITATSTDGSNKSGTCLVTVNLPVCSAVGNISFQVWSNIGSSTSVSALTSNINYPDNPSSAILLTSMEGPVNIIDDYGARIAGYICAPATGSYTFWIASDDNSELWLSTNDQPVNKQKIAYQMYYTGIREWNKYASQKSVTINLVEGQKYYIEALMKESSGYDNLAVGWLKPGQTGTEPSEVVPGSVLSPLGTKSKAAPQENAVFAKPVVELLVYPNPLNSDILNIKLENLTKAASLKIYSLSGILCYEEEIFNTGTVHIDRSVFRSGMYIIRVLNDELSLVSKLVVK